MHTFAVSDVKLADAPLPLLDRQTALKSLLHARVEQLPAGRELVLCSDLHPLAEAARTAFYDHRPLVLSPDAIWFCLVQGFAHHVSLNAEALRDRFVRQAGKKKLVVERADFVLGRENPWPEAFAAFSDQIAGHIGKLRELVVADFSTTGPTERASFEVALMDTFQPYFEYEMRVGCGIPSITLTGTPDDWRSVRRRASMLSEFGLEWWTDALLPVLDQLVLTAEGAPDRAFWQSYFRYETSSAGQELTGWIQVLFPYLIERVFDRPSDEGDDTELRDPIPYERQAAEASLRARRVPFKNPHLVDWKGGFTRAENRSGFLGLGNRQGPTIHDLPAGTASAPVRLIDVRTGAEQELRFVAGLFGVSQDSTGALAPEFGWAITYV